MLIIKIFFRNWFFIATIFVVLMLTVGVYWGGLSGAFLYDDIINVVNNNSLRLNDLNYEDVKKAAFSMSSGPLGRPLSMLSFAGNFYLNREKIEPFLTAFPFKLTNLLLHIINGILVFVFLQQVLISAIEKDHISLNKRKSKWIALAVASAWLLHPINLTSVLYVVQRMTILSAFFTLSGLCLYMIGRRGFNSGKRSAVLLIFASITLGTPLAALSKENGILLPIYIGAIEIFIFEFKSTSKDRERNIKIFILGLVALPISIGIVYFGMQAEIWISEYTKRDFSLPERMLTETRVLWFYIGNILLPTNTSMGFHHDDFPISRSILDPSSTLLAVVALLMIVPICLRLKKSQPLTVLGIAFFFIGHSLESTFIPLEIIHEHRNYFPMIGILLAVTVPLLSSTASFGALKIRIIFVCLMIILFAFCTYMRSLDWSTEYNLWSSEVRHHEFSMRSKGELAKMYANALTNNPTQKIEFDELAHQSFEQILFFDANNTMALFGLIQLHRYDAERFQQRWLLDLETGLRQKALPANTNDQLTTMAQCIVSKECQFDESNINMIMVAALKNSHVIGRDRALIYNAIVFYKYNITHDYVGALEAAKEAITLDSDVEHQFWMAKILLKMSNPIEAKNQIDKIKKMNLSIVRSDEILDMEAQLNAMK